MVESIFVCRECMINHFSNHKIVSVEKNGYNQCQICRKWRKLYLVVY